MKQGEIWKVNLDPTIGAEIKKTRPALILNANEMGRLPLRITIPITDWKDRYIDYPWMVKIEPTKANGLSKISAADCFQIRSVSTERFVEKLGMVEFSKLLKTQEALALVTGIE